MLEDFQLSSVDGEPVYIDSQGRSLSVSDYNNIVSDYNNIGGGSGGGDDRAFVEQTYINEVGRPGEAAGVDYWLNALNSGYLTRDQLSAAFSGTEEGKAFDLRDLTKTDLSGGGDDRAFVEQTYINEVGRPGEAAGVDYWLNALNSGYLTRDQLSAAFSGTEEGKAFDLRDKTKTDITKTEAVDQDLMDYLESRYMAEFGRKSDAEGIKYWYDAVKKGNLSKEQVAYAFSQAAEGLNYDLKNLAAGKLDLGYVSPDLLDRYNKLTSAFGSTLYRSGTADELLKYLTNPVDYAKVLGESDEAFVQKTYRDVLKFAPDAKGVQYWTNQLASGFIKREDLAKALVATQKQVVREQDIAKNAVVFNPFTSTVYSNLAMSDRASDFGSFPLKRSTRVTDTGQVVPTVALNLQQRPRVSLGIRGFSPPPATAYQYNPASYSLFGGERLFGGTGASGATNFNIFGSQAAYQPTQTTGGTSSVASGAQAGEEVVTAANGGMIMSDPVMRRAMFRAGGPVSSVGTGITSNVASPEENAKALQNMFAPGFRKGGEVQYFQEGGEAVDEETAPQGEVQASALERLRAQTRNPEPRFKPVMEVIREGRTLPIDREQAYTGRSMRGENRDIIQSPYAGGMEGFMPPQMQDVSAPPPPRYSAAERAQLARQAAADQIAEREMYRQAVEDEANYRGKTAEGATSRTAPPAREETKAPVKDRMSLRLEELKAEREANKEKRRENQLLALMQAGFAAAAGRSPNALANIAAGGISGVQTLAELQKETRAEDRALRREILETELTQERMREAAAERRAAREQTAAERQRSLLQNISSNTRQEISSINQIIATEEAKLLTPGITDEQKAPIKAEIARLKNQREAAVEQMYNVYESLGIRRPRTAEQGPAGGFPVRVVSSSPTQK